MKQKALLSIQDVIEETGIGRTTVYRLIREGKLRIVKIGTRSFVKSEDHQAFLDGLEPRAT